MLEKIQSTFTPFALRWPKADVPRRLMWAGLAIVIVVAIGAISWSALWRPAETSETAIAESTTPGSSSIVQLSPGKRQAADIHAIALEMRELRDVRRVPGQIGYNTAQRIEAKLPVGGVLARVLVKQGQNVQRGDPLAIVTSTEVGLARTEIASAQAEVEVAWQESKWADAIATNLIDLQQKLEERSEIADIERVFDDRLLGEHRDRVLTAYSKLLVTQRVARSTDEIASTGGVSGLVAQERRSAREVAAAQFQSALEQSKFDASQQQLRAKAALTRSERLLYVAQQSLSLLLGPYAVIAPAQQDDTLCELVVRAPLDGVVEDRLVTDGTHFTASQILFGLTNTDTLWVSAHICDRQWAVLNDGDIKEILVNAPAVADHPVKARVMFASVTTSAESGAVPLVAEFTNEGGHFKPGMFAWVSVPVSAPRQALAVPLSAVTRHEQRAFVFVEVQPGTYRRVDVDLGPATGEFVEVRHGLEPGQKVVDRGVLTLKSELLLGEVEG